MGHEIFLDIFDGPQKIFLIFSFLIFLVTSFKSLARAVWAQNAQMAIKGISGKKDMLKYNQNPHRYI